MRFSSVRQMAAPLRLAITIAILTPCAAVVPAHAETLQVNMKNDHKMGCAAIGREIETMGTVIRYSDEVQDEANETGTGISVVKAVGGFLIGSIPGALGVMAAGQVANEIAEGKAEDAAHLQDIAEQRRSMMIGMYGAKNCYGPVREVKAEDRRDKFLAAVEPAAGGTEHHPAVKVAHPYQYND